MKKHIWCEKPSRGSKNPKSEFYKYTITRLSDGKERFVDRLPQREIRESLDFLVWDNKGNQEI